MSGPKIALVFLILFAVMFAFAMTLGFLHPDDKATAANFNLNAHPVVRSFAGLFSSSSAEFHASGAGCLGHGAPLTSGAALTIAAGSACSLTIAAAGRRFLLLPPPSAQSVKFQVAAGAVTFTPRAGDDLNRGPQGPQTWPAGNSVETLTVHTGGGQLDLACGLGAACELRIK